MTPETLTQLRETSWQELHRAFDDDHAKQLATQLGLPLCRILVLTESSRQELITQYSNPQLPCGEAPSNILPMP